MKILFIYNLLCKEIKSVHIRFTNTEIIISKCVNTDYVTVALNVLINLTVDSAQ